MKKKEKLIKPAQFAEQEIIKAITEQKWKAFEQIPPERELSEILGITRPTLREALQRLARDGWITITHGKPTIVNDYKNSGGLGVLKSLINIKQIIPETLLKDWLEFRILIFPAITEKAVNTNPNKILALLNELPDINTSGKAFAIFDWKLQLSIVHIGNNSIAKMLYNDLADIYLIESSKYFDNYKTKKASLNYYNALKNAINNKQIVHDIVKTSMIESYNLWNSLKK